MSGPALHVLFRKEELDRGRPGSARRRVVVVLDLLFATTTIVTALDQGAVAVVPTVDETEARAVAATFPPNGVIAAGEKDLVVPEGFAEPSPLALLAAGVFGRPLVYCTTNGTVALCQAAAVAETVYVGALLNAPALAYHLATHHQGETVLLLCAGSGGSFNLEDAYGAGYLVDLLQERAPAAWRSTDAAIAARSIYRQWEARDCLSASRLGQLVRQVGMQAELDHAAQCGSVTGVPVFRLGKPNLITLVE